MIPRIGTMIEGGEERIIMIGNLQEDLALMLLLGVQRGERAAGRSKGNGTKRKRLQSGGQMRFMRMKVVVLLGLTQEKPIEMINQTEGGTEIGMRKPETLKGPRIMGGTVSCEILRRQMMLNGGMHRKG
jgi:hypothetical protein